MWLDGWQEKAGEGHLMPAISTSLGWLNNRIRQRGLIAAQDLDGDLLGVERGHESFLP